MIVESDKHQALILIKEAMLAGARLLRCCETIEISVRTYQRWKAGHIQDQRKGAKKNTPRKLSKSEREEIISICCDDEFKDKNPYDIVLTLLERGIYIASIRSFYRVLKENGLLHHRSNRRPGRKQSKPPEVKATGPDQVWTWDITWLPTEIRGIYLPAYMIKDIWHKEIVGWQIYDREDELYAKELFERTLSERGFPNVHIHSDNGNPMKGMSLLASLYDLGCKNSFSRPRVSNDNPFIESFFGTMKCSVKYPGRFKDIEDARIWMADFVNWYNTEHKHSGINYFTPQQMLSGEYRSLIKTRNNTMNIAHNRNPARWSKKVKQWNEEHVVYLNPNSETKRKLKKAA